MNNFYTLLPFHCETTDFSIFKGDLFITYQDYGLSYYEINNIKLFESYLPSNILNICPNLIKFVEVDTHSVVPPHIDYKWPNCSINFYFSPGDGEVIWYTAKNSNREQISDEQYTILFQEDELLIKERLLAEPNKFYLFNNSEIHSVHTNTQIRQFIQIQFENSYSELLEIINNFLKAR